MTSQTSSIQVSPEAIEAGKTAWAEWENGNLGSTLGECVQHVYLAMKAAEPLPQGDEVREVLELAYGHLWMMQGVDRRIQKDDLACTARAILLSKIDRPEGQKRGIDAARKSYRTAIGSQSIAPECVHCGAIETDHEPSGCCGDGGGSTFSNGVDQ